MQILFSQNHVNLTRNIAMNKLKNYMVAFSKITIPIVTIVLSVKNEIAYTSVG